MVTFQDWLKNKHDNRELIEELEFDKSNWEEIDEEPRYWGFDHSKGWYIGDFGKIKNGVEINGWPNLKEIKINDIDSQWFSLDYDGLIIKNCPQLKRIQIRNFSIKNLEITDLLQLKHLSLSGLNIESTKFSKFPQLEELSLVNFYNVIPNYTTIQNFPRLMWTNSSDYKDSSWVNLKKVEIIDNNQYRELRTFINLYDPKNLEELKLNKFYDFGQQKIVIDLNKYPKLTKLDITNSPVLKVINVFHKLQEYTQNLQEQIAQLRESGVINNTSLETKIQELTSKINQQENNQGVLSTQIDNLETKNNSLQAEVNQISELKTQLATTNQDLTNLKNSLSSYQQEAEQTNEQNLANLQEQMINYQKDLEEKFENLEIFTKERIQSLETQLLSEQTKNQILTQELTEFQAASLRAKLAAKKKEFKETKEDIIKRNNLNEDAQEELTNLLEIQTDYLKDKLSSLEKQLERTKKRLSKLITNEEINLLCRIQQELTELQNKSEEFQTQIVQLPPQMNC